MTSQAQSTGRPPLRLFAGPNKALIVFGGIFFLFVLLAIAAPLVSPGDPYPQNLLARLKPPGTPMRGGEGVYYLGTDELGRDLLSRIIYGARVSLAVAFLSVALSGIVGAALGMFAAYRRGLPDTLIMRAADIVLSVPGILIALIVVAALGPGLINVVIVLAITRWPRYARVAYAQTLQISAQPYVRLSKVMGSSVGYIMLRHVLPNIIGPLAVVATLEFGLMILWESGLSFLGLGVQPPVPSWGSVLASGRNYVNTAWWISVFPGLALFFLILTVNMFGDALRTRLDPRSQ